MTARAAKISAAGIAIGLGIILLAWTTPNGELNLGQAALAAVVCLFAWTAGVYRQLHAIHTYLEQLSPRRYVVMLAIVAIVLLAYFLIAARIAQRPLYPTFHDEHMYLLQASMLAEGHLTLPPHACAEFFDTFYVLVKPVYSSMYFPGTALAYVLPHWLKLPWCVWPLLITTGALLMSLIVAARVLRSRVLGLCVVMGVLGIESMGYLPTMSMSHTLATLLGMSIVYAWLRWRESPTVGWAILCGALAGWMVISRPAEGVAFSVPVVLAVLGSIRPANWKRVLVHATLAMLAAAPFLALQAAHNRAVTGSVFEFPINFYVNQEFVGLGAAAGLQQGATQVATRSELAQKKVMFETFVAPMNLMHANETLLQGIRWRLSLILQYGLPSPLLYFLLPAALLLIRHAPAAVLCGIAGVYLAVYTRYSAYLPQYSVQIAPVFLILVLLSATALAELWPKRARQIQASYVVGLLALSILAISQLKQVGLWGREVGVLQAVHERFSRDIRGSALVLIKYDKRESPHAEPVYNLERAKIDDNRIVLAHDLGDEKNQKIIGYYAARQPERILYYFDRLDFTLAARGTVREVAERLGLKSGD